MVSYVCNSFYSYTDDTGIDVGTPCSALAQVRAILIDLFIFTSPFNISLYHGVYKLHIVNILIFQTGRR